MRQEPKSTYLLLGNVSLADTIVGFSIIFSKYLDNSNSSNIWCVIEVGMIVCHAKVSIFSVGLIAVDRYIYILHGLYYQRWFNITRVRIGILCIWAVSITLGFMPATGWTNKELPLTRCYYVGLFPGNLILLNSLLSIVPIIVVAVLYSIILVRALKNVKILNAATKNLDKSTNEKPKLRMYRGTVSDKKSSTYSIPSVTKSSGSIMKIDRSASFNYLSNDNAKDKIISVKSKSIDDFTNDKTNIKQYYYSKDDIQGKTRFESDFSVYSVESHSSDKNSSDMDRKTSNELEVSTSRIANRKVKEPNKWRAITVVMLTSGSFIITWMPFFIAVIFFYFCEEKLTNPKCMHIQTLLSGPLVTLAFSNSILNPLIYAWWHKGFKRSVKTCYKKCLHKLMCHIN
ncbi:dopamine receptor 4 isoform X2 [Manduca sexta]|uniref:dopamine receptor 4 isoform X2 n=1 Tax=Manduca sexta TaxID=7130 RepID=UPI00189011CA|nr:dopamine receptor 4 isoform X2 [Manduca sexta]